MNFSGCVIGDATAYVIVLNTMEKKHIITISGKPGSGKSSTADKVAELLSYTRYSSGDIVRNLLAREHITLAEYNARASKDHSFDEKLINYYVIYATKTTSSSTRDSASTGYQNLLKSILI